MAEHEDGSDRSEEPTQRKLDDAHNKGDVAKSQEVNAWFVLTGATVIVLVFAQGMFADIARDFKGLLANLHALPVDAAGLQAVASRISLAMLGALAMPLLVLMLAALGGNLVQHRFVWSLEPAKPKLSKISPLKGFKRLFSTQSLVNFAKGIAKLATVSLVMFLIVWPERDRLDGLVSLHPSAVLAAIQAMALKLLAGVVAVMTIIAALDYGWQQHSWHKRQMMSVRELKDEYKQMEGDPIVRAKLRQVRMERSRKRMMAQVPDATVIVANPTHYAVALKYEHGMPAPVCLAKGVDATALRIRALGEESGVPVIENPPLARTLHAAVEIDEEIPPEHYKAVAEIIGYVMQIRARAGWRTNRP